MTPQELLKPRYKVIADYPLSSRYFEIGAILTWDETYQCYQSDGLHGAQMHRGTVEKYPHLFKKLEWWEERKPEEMPYAIEIKNEGYKSWKNGCYRYAELVDGFHYWYVKTDRNKFFPQKLGTKLGDYETHPFGLKNARPITKEEYELFTKKEISL